MKIRFALLAAITLTLIAIVAAALISRFDPVLAGEAVRDHVRERYGRELQLDGQMSLSIWPVLSISVPRASLSEVGSDRPAAGFERANAEIAWLPLLRGRVIVERLRVAGLHLRVEQYADDSRNIDNLIAPLSATPDAAPGDEPPSRAPRVEINRVELSEASLEFEHLGTGQRLWLDDIELRLDELASRMVTPVSLRARMVLAPDGPSALVRVTGTLDVDPARRSVGLRGVEASVRGFMSGQPIDANARARRASITLGRPGLVGRIESFAIGFKGGLPTFQIEAAHMRGTSLEFDGTRLSLVANGLEANLRGRAGPETVEASLSLPELTIANPVSRGRPVELNARLRGSHELDLKLTFDGISGGVQNFTASRMGLVAEASSGEFESTLRMTATLRADLDAASLNVSQIAGAITLEPGAGKAPIKLPLAGSVHAELGGPMLDAELETRIEASALRTRARFDPTGQDAPLTLTVNADVIDADRLMTLFAPVASAIFASPSSASRATLAPTREQSPAPLPSPSRGSESVGVEKPLSPLAGIATRGWNANVRIGQFKAGTLSATEVSAALKSSPTGLRIRSIALSALGGSLNGQADWYGPSGDFTLSLRGQAMDVAPLLESLGHASQLTGKAEWRADLGGRTGSPFPVEDLRGQVSLRLVNGRVQGLDLLQTLRVYAQRLRSIRQTPRRPEDIEPATPRLSDVSEFTQFGATFVLRDGKARTRDIVLETAQLRVSGGGEVDLEKGMIDAGLRIGVRTHGGDPLLMALGRLAVPLKIQGPLTEPVWTLDGGPARSRGTDAGRRVP